MAERAFCVIYARDVAAVAGFYVEQLGFEERFRLPPDGEPGFVTLGRGASELGVVNAAFPQETIGVAAGDAPRFEVFAYVDDVDAAIDRMTAAGVPVLRTPTDMPWGERVAYVSDPEGNPVAVAT